MWSIAQMDYANNKCLHHNRYNGWCNYYDCECVDKLEECEFAKENEVTIG